LLNLRKLFKGTQIYPNRTSHMPSFLLPQEPVSPIFEEEELDSLLKEKNDELKQRFDELGRNLRILQKYVNELNNFVKDDTLEPKILFDKNDTANTLSKLMKKQFLDLAKAIKECRRKNEDERDMNAIRDLIYRKLNADFDLINKDLQNISKKVQQREREQRKRVIVQNEEELPANEPINMQTMLILEEEQKKQDFEFKIVEYKDEEDEELKEIEQGVQGLSELFTTVHDEVHSQELKMQAALQNVDDAMIATEIGTKDLQTAARLKSIGAIVGATALGGVVGCVVAGPIGAVVAAKTAFGLATTVGGATVVGFGLGAVSGFVTKTVSDKFSGANLKFWEKKKKLDQDEQPTQDVEPDVK
jgi:hypothetical protein